MTTRTHAPAAASASRGGRTSLQVHCCTVSTGCVHGLTFLRLTRPYLAPSLAASRFQVSCVYNLPLSPNFAFFYLMMQIECDSSSLQFLYVSDRCGAPCCHGSWWSLLLAASCMNECSDRSIQMCTGRGHRTERAERHDGNAETRRQCRDTMPT